MIIEKTNERFSQEAVQLLLDDYNKQKKAIQYFPESEDFKESLSKKTRHLFNSGTGFCFYENDKLLGFLAGYTVKNFFGSSDGVYVPLYGHCISSEVKNRIKLYQKMYAYTAGNWVNNKLLSHVITVFATDRELLNTWFNLGFGNRCVDAIRETTEIPAINEKIIIKKAKRRDIESLEKLYKKASEYFSTSPLFMAQSKKPSINTLLKWFESKGSHLWIAYFDHVPVGYMKIEDEGESYIVEHPGIMNITGAYVTEEQRGKGIASAILNEIQKWLKQNNFKMCGVDFESFNISGNAFWNRYFSPYTYSLVRRIDENILLF